MATQAWNDQRAYKEGERVSYKGRSYDARFDLIRNIRPDDPLGKKFWRAVPSIRVATSPHGRIDSKDEASDELITITKTRREWADLVDAYETHGRASSETRSKSSTGYMTKVMRS